MEEGTSRGDCLCQAILGSLRAKGWGSDGGGGAGSEQGGWVLGSRVTCLGLKSGSQRATCCIRTLVMVRALP